MFRTMRRIKQAVSEEACKKVLSEEKRGAFSIIGDGGYPYALPINFYYDEEDRRIYFHGAKEGHKADAIRACDKVCFTTWDTGFKKEGRWEYNVTSVIVFGRVRMINEKDIVEEKLRTLAAKYYPSIEEAEEEIRHAIDRVQLYAIDIEHMSGKLVSER
ncbi:MAG TPA: pyridoxamine 5'-phosphate oxidase family protein [Papillibacter sp.]|jgi:nitroimidazol reductase NimA-like FMN-containing flavoprotein (pyridoxamine 5'-phosphate oxidase superfamily)|nr:pyridoxamine 5'-phosphate oxidase family protein [Papillibacter sp.]